MLAIGVAASSARAQATINLVSQACTNVGSLQNPDSARVDHVKNFCNVKLSMQDLMRTIDTLKSTGIELTDLYAVQGDRHIPSSVGPMWRMLASAPRDSHGEGVIDGGVESRALWAAENFLVNRTKEELSLYIALQLRPALCGDAAKLAMLVKATCRVLPDDESGRLPSLSLLRSALQDDLNNLPDNLLARYQADQGSTTDRAMEVALVRLTLTTTQAMQRGRKLDAVLGAIADSLVAAEGHGSLNARTLVGRVFLAAQVGRVFDQATLGDGSLSPAEVLHYAFLATYLNIRDGITSDRASLEWNMWATAVRSAPQLYTGGVQLVADVKAQSDPKADDKTRLAGALQVGLDFADLLRIAMASVDVDTDTSPARDLADALLGALRPVPAYLATGNYSAMTNAVLTAAADPRVKALTPLEQRAFSFAVEASSAKDADAMQQAIEHFAAPVGSYAAKRAAGKNTFLLNAYVGGWFGDEIANVSENQGAFSAAPYVAIGVEWAHGYGHGRSFSVFLQLLDLGQLASWRFGNSAAVKADPPPVTLGQVISPGVSFLWAVGRSPFVFGLNASWSPKNRFLANATEPTVSTFRVGAIAAIDIPIFP